MADASRLIPTRFASSQCRDGDLRNSLPDALRIVATACRVM
jgi:hypothetical protein